MVEVGSPTAKLIIERKSTSTASIRPASVFDFDTFQFDATVDFAVNESGSGFLQLTVDIPNVSNDIFASLKPSGAVQLIAGYNSGGVAPSSIFHGEILYGYRYRRGAEKVLRLVAVSHNILYEHVVPPVVVKDVQRSVGDVIKESISSYGGKVKLPPAAFTAKISNYQPLHPLKTELETRLIPELDAQLKRKFYLVPDIDSANSFVVVDSDKPEEFVALKININTAKVYSSSIGIVSCPPSTENPVVEDEAALEELLIETRCAEYRISLAFDPRIVPGMFIFVEDPEIGGGKFVTTTLSHRIGRDEWVTDVSGLFEGKEFFL